MHDRLSAGRLYQQGNQYRQHRDLGTAKIWGASDTITEIKDIAFPSDGSVWVLNDKAPYLVKFDPTGKVERVWGGRGGGPGEFQSPQNLMTVNGGKDVWVEDPGKGGFLDLSASVEDPPLARIPQSVRLIPMGFTGGKEQFWTSPSDSGVLVARTTGGEDLLVMYHAELAELRPDGSITARLNLAQHLGDPTKSYPGASEFLPYPLVAACPDRTISLYDPTANVIRRFSASGAMIDSILLTGPKRVAMTFEKVFRVFYPVFVRQAGDRAKDTAQLRATVQKEWEAVRSQIASVFPEYFDLQCDGANRLWIQPFDVEGGDLGRGPVWYQITSQGKLGGIKMPAGFRPAHFAMDRVWGIVRDDNDIPSIAWVALPANPSETGGR